LKAVPSIRRNAALVASIATAIGMACFIVIAVFVNVLLAGHMISQVDSRLHERLDSERRTIEKGAGDKNPSVIPASGDQDSDDVPIYVWRVTSNGTVTASTFAAPTLPQRRWSGNTTISMRTSTFRVDATHDDGGWLVAGESLANINRLRSLLLTLEIVAGAILAILMFLAAFVVGVRAQGPIALAQRRQSEFTSDASHELRTPLSVIEAEVDVALSQERDSSSYQGTLQRIKGEGHRLQKIVEDLLWLARSDEHRKSPPSNETSDVAAIASFSSQRFESLALARGITITYVREGDDDALVAASSEAIDRLIGVLVDNACKFAGQSGLVNVTVLTQSHRTILRVDDSGPGIPISDRDLIFNRFHHSDSTSSGTGLGLAIADAIIISTHAQCTIEDADIGGARFEISWRRASA
jgi:signal transduction histidine kinase